MEKGGHTAVIFVSRLTGEDPEGYACAAARMEALAAEQSGYAGLESARDANGLGITVSRWTSEAAALAWRDQPEHARVREEGRRRWYGWYRVEVARVDRAYEWVRA